MNPITRLLPIFAAAILLAAGNPGPAQAQIESFDLKEGLPPVEAALKNLGADEKFEWLRRKRDELRTVRRNHDSLIKTMGGEIDQLKRDIAGRKTELENLQSFDLEGIEFDLQRIKDDRDYATKEVARIKETLADQPVDQSASRQTRAIDASATVCGQTTTWGTR